MTCAWLQVNDTDGGSMHGHTLRTLNLVLPPLAEGEYVVHVFAVWHDHGGGGLAHRGAALEHAGSSTSLTFSVDSRAPRAPASPALQWHCQRFLAPDLCEA